MLFVLIKSLAFFVPLEITTVDARALHVDIKACINYINNNVNIIKLKNYVNNYKMYNKL